NSFHGTCRRHDHPAGQESQHSGHLRQAAHAETCRGGGHEPLMLGLDTNVLVRLLIEDDAAQTRRARMLVDAAIAQEEVVLVSLPVLLETVCMLRTPYEIPPEAILSLFR